MKILKFGGKSLANGEGLEKAIAIITEKIATNEKIAVVVSARGNATDELEHILNIASKGEVYKPLFDAFKKYQIGDYSYFDFSEEFILLEKLFEGVSLIGDYSAKIKDQILANGGD
jgi:aspartokinase/homoserine dehydrogenase 1